MKKYGSLWRNWTQIIQSSHSWRSFIDVLPEWYVPKPRTSGGRRPWSVLFDPCNGVALFTKGIRKLNKMTIFHRHSAIGGKGAPSVSLYFRPKLQGNGRRNRIRIRTTIVHLRPKTIKNPGSTGGVLGWGGEGDVLMYEQATEGEHNALAIDSITKRTSIRVTENLDTFLQKIFSSW